MKNRLSQKDLNKLYRKEVRKSGKEKVFNKFRDSKSTRENNRKTIFLSHSHLDKTIVVKIGLLFEKLNTNLYIDWLDNTLPENTNRTTANEIKNKINGSDKFIFLATYHGLRSKWCNWELGIADSLKKHRNVAILPIETSTGN